MREGCRALLWPLAVAGLLAAEPAAAGSVGMKAIHGNDDRVEACSAPAPYPELARSVAGKVPDELLRPAAGGFTVEGVALGRRYCPTIRFAEQIFAPTCSGFLVGPDLLATAAHCMREAVDCSGSAWVFGYALRRAGDAAYTTLSAEQVYRCRKVEAKRLEGFGAVDYALIRLDRPVPDRAPLALDLEAGPSTGSAVVTIGHPSGLPQKFTGGASILRSDALHFEADLDNFGGNSGSPVFDTATGKVAGILSRGHASYVRQGDCKVPKVCLPEEGCYLAFMSRLRNLKDDLEKLQGGQDAGREELRAGARRAEATAAEGRME